MVPHLFTQFFHLYVLNLLEALRMESFCKFFNGIRYTGAGKHFRKGNYQEILIFDSGYIRQSIVVFQSLDFLVCCGLAVIIDNDDVRISLYNCFPSLRYSRSSPDPQIH